MREIIEFFSQKYGRNVALLEVINTYITFWIENLPTKVWKTFLCVAAPEKLLGEELPEHNKLVPE